MIEVMKQIIITALLIIIVGFLGLYIYVRLGGFKRDASHDCGGWGPLVGGKPTCDCDGSIIRRGGPSGPADDSGGWFECVGTIRGRLNDKEP